MDLMDKRRVDRQNDISVSYLASAPSRGVYKVSCESGSQWVAEHNAVYGTPRLQESLGWYFQSEGSPYSRETTVLGKFDSAEDAKNCCQKDAKTEWLQGVPFMLWFSLPLAMLSLLFGENPAKALVPPRLQWHTREA